MKKYFKNYDDFLIDVGQVANDPKDFHNPLHLILKMVNERMYDTNWIPVDWKLQRKLTHKEIKKGIDWK